MIWASSGAGDGQLSHMARFMVSIVHNTIPWIASANGDQAWAPAFGLRTPDNDAPHATSAITTGMVIAARIVCSVMIWAKSGASPPIWRAST